jgi:uncharacterized protein DUF2330
MPARRTPARLARPSRLLTKAKSAFSTGRMIHADTTAAFTNWLDANQYPYTSAATSAFNYYVGQSWYFVAFKVTADSQDPPDEGVLCGDLGPIQLAFPATSPVVPAQYHCGGDRRWWARLGARRGGRAPPQLARITIDDHQTSLAAAPATLRFSGTLSASDLVTHPTVAQLGAAGNRLTEFEVDFSPWLLQSDLVFQPAPADIDFRRSEYQYRVRLLPERRERQTQKHRSSTAVRTRRAFRSSMPAPMTRPSQKQDLPPMHRPKAPPKGTRPLQTRPSGTHRPPTRGRSKRLPGRGFPAERGAARAGMLQANRAPPWPSSLASFLLP